MTMTIQNILNTFNFSEFMPGEKAAVVYTVLDEMKIGYWKKGQSPEDYYTYIVGESVKKDEGFTPEEYLAYTGEEYNSFRWTASDGMGCGVGLKNGVICRIIDYGGFNSRPCYDRVTTLARATAQEFTVTNQPNSYNYNREMGNKVKEMLQGMGAL